MAPLVRGKSVPLQICLYQYLFVLSLPIQISVLTQEKSLPTKSDKSDGRTPTGESAETAKAGNHSLSLKRVLLKFGWVFFFENKK